MVTLMAFGCARSHHDAPELGVDPVPRDAGLSEEGDDSGPSVVVPEDGGRRQRPDAGTADYSTEFRWRACNLTDRDLIGASLRANTCLGLYADVLQDFARGFAYDESNHQGYSDYTFGNCQFVRCLAEAIDCAAAGACFEDLIGEPCDDATRSHCEGDRIVDCQYIPARGRNHEIEAQDCRRVGMACVELEEGAYCESFPDEIPNRCEGSSWSGYGYCDGDDAVRCVGGDESAYLDRIECDRLIEGGTCFEVPIGGEAPGAHCLRADECLPEYTVPSCASEVEIQLCVHGENRTFDCRDFGYAGCSAEREDGRGIARCLP